VKPGRARNHLVPGRMAMYTANLSEERLAEAEMKRALFVDEVEDTEDDKQAKVRQTALHFSLSNGPTQAKGRQSSLCSNLCEWIRS
jgi:hypothetical protein